MLRGIPGTFVKQEVPTKINIGWGRHQFLDNNPTLAKQLRGTLSSTAPQAKKKSSTGSVNWSDNSSNPVRTQPELDLITKYVKFHGRQSDFVRLKIQGQALYCDLYDKNQSRLYEAKILRPNAKDNRNRLRLAFAQLYDYKRFLPRSTNGPFRRIGLLLNRRPEQGDLDFLRKYRVAVVWLKDDGESFDSNPKTWTRR